MADEELHLMAAIYPTKEDATYVLEALEMMHKNVTITLEDAVLISKNAEGKIDIDESDEMTTREGATRGALIGGAFGLIFPPAMIVTGLIGGAIGGLIGRIRDTGIENDQMAGIAEQLQPGGAAVVALTPTASVPQVQNAMTGFEGELVVQPLSDEASKQIFELKGKGIMT